MAAIKPGQGGFKARKALVAASVSDGSGDHIFSDDVHFVDARGYEILAERIAELVEAAGVMP